MKDGLLKFLRHPTTITAGVGIMSFGAGVCAGYILANRNKQEPEPHDEPMRLGLDLDKDSLVRDEDISEEEAAIAESQAFLDKLHEKEMKERGADIATPAEAFILEHLEGTVVLEKEPHPIEVVAQSIFAAPTDDWDYEEELRHRTTEAPYVLHADEFYAEEMRDQGYQQTTMTYYKGDNVMADQENTPVYNYPAVVGPLLFGHGSGDPNVFHVRNDKRKEEYEIIFDDGHFAYEVLGLEEETDQNLKHAGPPKFRQE